MWIFSKLFGNKKVIDNDEEQAVFIHFTYGKKDMSALYKLRDELENAIEPNNLGDYDGHEIASDFSDGSIYMYGLDAELLFKTIKPILDKTDFMKGAKAKLIYGSPGSDAKRTIISI